jgi:hypothetical protein
MELQLSPFVGPCLYARQISWRFYVVRFAAWLGENRLWSFKRRMSLTWSRAFRRMTWGISVYSFFNTWLGNTNLSRSLLLSDASSVLSPLNFRFQGSSLFTSLSIWQQTKNDWQTFPYIDQIPPRTSFVSLSILSHKIHIIALTFSSNILHISMKERSSRAHLLATISRPLPGRPELSIFSPTISQSNVATPHPPAFCWFGDHCVPETWGLLPCWAVGGYTQWWACYF